MMMHPQCHIQNHSSTEDQKEKQAGKEDGERVVHCLLPTGILDWMDFVLSN